jgi:S-adenosylmethionine-diacylgycerolhomoserine-N-methlytransferase
MSARDAARMDAIYARQRHIYDLTRKYYLLGRDRLIAQLDVPTGGTVLEVGCGTGRNLIAVARKFPSARLYGLDISEAMLVTARAKIEAAGLSERITLRKADATDFDAKTLFGIDQFDRVVFSYTLSMIPNWRAAIARGVAATAGRLSLVDFGQQEALPNAWRRALFAWLAKFDVSPRATLFDDAAACAGEAAMHPEPRSLYRGYAWAVTLTRP